MTMLFQLQLLLINSMTWIFNFLSFSNEGSNGALRAFLNSNESIGIVAPGLVRLRVVLTCDGYL